ncbi:MAG: hypothetical protein KBS95_08360 [Alistipes sp.]|nr:hypothetical protein [Candidatus Alistipes equi]
MKEYSISENLIGNPFIMKVLRELKLSYDELSAPLYVVGAAARDILLKVLGVENAPRQTMGLDVAVLLEQWSEYDALSEILVSHGFKKAPEKHKFLYPIPGTSAVYEVDVVPFGTIACDEQVAWPPEGDPVMSVRCFSEVMNHALQITVDGNLSFSIASMSGQWLIKLDAWSDRHLRTRKDAADMQFFLENAYVVLALEADGIPEEISLDAENFDITVAGAEWLASEMKGILSTKHRALYSSLLSDELALEEDSHLLNDLADYARISSFNVITKALSRMVEILRPQ